MTPDLQRVLLWACVCVYVCIGVSGCVYECVCGCLSVCMFIGVYSFCAYMTTIFVLYVHIITSESFFLIVPLFFNCLLKTPAGLLVLNVVSYNEIYWPVLTLSSITAYSLSTRGCTFSHICFFNKLNMFKIKGTSLRTLSFFSRWEYFSFMSHIIILFTSRTCFGSSSTDVSCILIILGLYHLSHWACCLPSASYFTSSVLVRMNHVSLTVRWRTSSRVTLFPPSFGPLGSQALDHFISVKWWWTWSK